MLRLSRILPFLAAAGWAALAVGAEDLREESSPELLREASTRWAKHLVPVEVWLKRSEGEDPSRFPGLRHFTGRVPRGSLPEGQWEEKRPVELAGLAVDERTVWLPDLGIERRFIARVQAGRPPGAASLMGAYLPTPVWVVRVEAPLPGVGRLAFSGSREAKGLLALGSWFGQGGWVLSLAPVADYRQLGQALWGETARGALILDRDLQPLGYTGSGRLGISGAPDLWRGEEIAGSALLEFEALDRSQEELTRKLGSLALTVRGFLRREEEGGGRRRFRMRWDEDSSRNDFMATGYTVSPRQVLVNHRLGREAAVRLERVAVLVDGEERPARFLGALRHFHAFLVEISGKDLPEPLDLSSDRRLEVSQPLLALTADHQSGRRRDRVEMNRVSDLERGYRGVIEPILQRFPSPGTVFVNPVDRTLQGVVLEVKREDLHQPFQRSFRSSGGIDLRLLTPRELREVIEQGEAGYDRRLVPRPVEREKDMVWFGVQVQTLSRELARSHGVEIPTRGGEVGVIVVDVHAGSPAVQAGVAPGDILLSFREEEESEPWEVSPRGEFDREDHFEMPVLEDPADVEEFHERMGPPWRSPRNFLNEKLTQIGEGRKVEVTFLRQGMERRAWVTLDIAPPDFENAPQHRSDELGLTVKDLTYEVRAQYRLKEDAPGVVVSKVEPGSKAAIAKVLPYEILVSMNGKVVRSVADFRKVLEDLGAPGEGMLEFKLERMGKSRLVRIRR